MGTYLQVPGGPWQEEADWVCGLVLLRLGAPQGSAQWWEPALLSSERGALPAMVPPSCCQPWRGSRTNFRSPAWVGAQAGAALLPPEHPIPSQSVAPVPSRAISPPYQGPSPQAGWEQRLQAERPLQQKWESGLREGCRTGRLSSPRAPPFSRSPGAVQTSSSAQPRCAKHPKCVLQKRKRLRDAPLAAGAGPAPHVHASSKTLPGLPRDPSLQQPAPGPPALGTNPARAELAPSWPRTWSSPQSLPRARRGHGQTAGARTDGGGEQHADSRVTRPHAAERGTACVDQS